MGKRIVLICLGWKCRSLFIASGEAKLSEKIPGTCQETIKYQLQCVSVLSPHTWGLRESSSSVGSGREGSVIFTGSQDPVVSCVFVLLVVVLHGEIVL